VIFESHAHYDDKAFDEDRETLLSSLTEKGIAYVVNVGSNMETSATSVALAARYPYIYAAVGVHPSDTAELNEERMQELERLCHEPKVVAVGEIGLDYHWDEPAPELQQQWFIRQLVLARTCHKPVIIHSRDAAKDTYDIMRTHHAEEIGGVIHCYSYSPDMALDYVRMGYYIGIGGVITFKNGKKMKEVAAAVPLQRILLETDSPYLSPIRGERNTSLNLPTVAQEIADIKGVTYEEVVETTYNNAKTLFGIQQ